jgi:hypothetical protein
VTFLSPFSINLPRVPDISETGIFPGQIGKSSS